MSYFTKRKVFLMPSYDPPKKEMEKLDKYLEILEESGVGKIIKEETKTDRSKGGRISYNPYNLFAAIVYSFSKNRSTVREIEESINYDLRSIYLMEQERPSYVTISKFLNNVVVKRQKEIYCSIIKSIINKYQINTEDVFLDGTKFEANANKYKFVWKPTTFHKKLNKNIKELLSDYFTISENKITFISKEVAEYLSLLSEQIKEKNIDTNKIGKGHKTPKIYKDYKKLEAYLLKVLEYEEKEEICGDSRNSYYKTDKDATAMCLKEDYYSGLGSNMHAGYNIQILVSKGIVIDYYVCQDRNDYNALIPILRDFYDEYNYYPNRLCADSGYGSFNNYLFLKEHNIENYVKYSLWQKETKGEIVELYKFDKDHNLICLNNKIAKQITDVKRHNKSKGTKFYLINSCFKCKYKKICGKALKYKIKNERVFEVSEEYYLLKKEAQQNLLSPKGIEMRVNRSSQVEGVFGVIKQDMNYERVRRRGLENVSAEIMLVCLGYVLKKIFKLIDGTGSIKYWQAPENLAAEKIIEVDINKLINKKKKVVSMNNKTKQDYKQTKRTVKNSVS